MESVSVALTQKYAEKYSTALPKGYSSVLVFFLQTVLPFFFLSQFNILLFIVVNVTRVVKVAARNWDQ